MRSSRGYALATLLLAGCGARESVPLAGEWPCTVERADGSREHVERYTWPMDVRRAPGSAPVRVIDCRILLGPEALAGPRPAALLGRVGRSDHGQLEVWLDGVRLPESDLRAGPLFPIPLLVDEERAQQGAVLRVRSTRSGDVAIVGDPDHWRAGPARVLARELMQAGVPDLVAVAILALGALLSAFAAVSLRRSQRDLASFAVVAAYCACVAVVRFHDNPLRGLLGIDGGVPLLVVRFVAGMGIVGCLVEVLRRHFEVRLSLVFSVFYVVLAVCAVARVPMALGLGGGRFLNLTNFPAFAGWGFFLYFLVRALRDPRPGSRALFAGLAALLAFTVTRLLSLLGLPQMPDLAGWGFLLLAVAAVAASIQAAAHRRARLERARVLERYVPAALVRRVLEGAAPPRQERRRLTIFFSDLRGFTSLSDRIEPEVLSAVLTHYLSEMATIAEKHGGTVDKFIGDAVMVFFGAPDELPPEDGAISCVAMAIEMQRAMPELNEQWPAMGLHEPLAVRMGISTGVVTVGEFGSAQRSDYTAIGSAVNLAQRLESSCPAGKVLISQGTHALVRERFRCLPVEPIVPKGFDRPMPVWLVDPEAPDGEAVAEPIRIGSGERSLPPTMY